MHLSTELDQQRRNLLGVNRLLVKNLTPRNTSFIFKPASENI